MNAPCTVFHDDTSGEQFNPPVRYIRSHTALRGVAALLVVSYHLQFGAPHRLAIETATPFFQRGYLMVDLFFILSGFVISLTNDADHGRSFTRAKIRQFYVARIVRIYPLHLFCLCVIVVSTLGLTLLRHWHHPSNPGAWINHDAAGSLVAEVFLVQAWLPGAPCWNIPSWSISAELVAYALFPLILVLRSRLAYSTTVVMTLVPLVFYLSVLHGSGSLDIIAGLAPLRCLSGFMIGMILYDLRCCTAKWSNGVIAGCQLIAVAAIFVVLATHCPDPVIVPFFALLVIVTWQDRGPVPALLCHSSLFRLGELSYSIYLTHVGLIAIIFPFWYFLTARFGIPAGPARTVLIVASLVVILLASKWTYTHVEQASRRRLRRLFAASRWQ